MPSSTPRIAMLAPSARKAGNNDGLVAVGGCYDHDPSWSNNFAAADTDGRGGLIALRIPVEMP
jgi:hypothetical protein